MKQCKVQGTLFLDLVQRLDSCSGTEAVSDAAMSEKKKNVERWCTVGRTTKMTIFGKSDDIII